MLGNQWGIMSSSLHWHLWHWQVIALLGYFLTTAIWPLTSRLLRGSFCQAAGQRDPDLSHTHTRTRVGKERTTLGRLSLVHGAWETDGDESLMLGTRMTNKPTSAHTPHAADVCTYSVRYTHSTSLSHTHIRPFPIYSGVFFLCAIPDFAVTKTDGGSRGEWLCKGRG